MGPKKRKKIAIPEDGVYFIAEIGLNHNGHASLARSLIDVAVSSGCKAVKFQKRTVGNMFVDQLLDQPFERFPELGRTMREVREGLELSKKEYRALRDHCAGRIDFGVTPFDIPSVAFLDDLDIDFFKVASHSATDTPLLHEIAKRGKPVVASVGMCNAREIERMVKIFADASVDLTLLHCVSSYPTETKDANLGVIQWLRRFGRPIGYSDHEDGINVASVAAALGAVVIEKHVTLDKNMPGFDHAMSIEPTQLVECVRNLNQVRQAVHAVENKELQPCETFVFDNRRVSLFAACQIDKGTEITPDMIAVRAPLVGLTPRFFDKVVGRTALYDMNKDDPITFGMVDIT